MEYEIKTEEKWHRVAFRERRDAALSDSLFYRIDTILDAIKSTYALSQRPVVFDLSHMEHIDSSMISIIVQTLRIVKDDMCAAIAPHQTVRDIMIALGMDSMIEIYLSEKELLNDIE
jgi:anti-anti-sigma regulatory factor